MPTHVALLRGVNVGGVKLVMADLRRLVTSLGHSEVTTYIQSGNVVFTPAHADSLAVAQELEAAIAAELNLRSAVIVLARTDLAEVVSSNPYPDEPNPRFVHGVFLPADPDELADQRVREAAALAAEQGSRDEAALIGRTLYLHTPDGFGTSGLAKELLQKRSSPAAAGTARNWATVTKLLTLCG